MNPEIPGYKVSKNLYESSITLICRGARLINGETIVLKILKPETASEKDELTRFRHEYDIISKLNISGVARLVTFDKYH